MNTQQRETENTLAVSHRLPGESSASRLWISLSTAIRDHLQILSLCLLALALTICLQALSITVHSPAGNAVVDTVTGSIGALASFVFAGRMRSTHQLRDLLIALALGTLSATDLILVAGPTLVEAEPGNSWHWIVLAGRIVGGGALLGAAFCPDVDLGKSTRRPETIILATAALLVGLIAAIVIWHTQLPSLLGDTSGPSGFEGYGVSSSHPLLNYLQLAGSCFAACAAFGLARHSARTGDALGRSLAAGVAVLAVARLDYFFFAGAPRSSRLYPGDILKLGAYLVILYGCLLEFRASQRRLVARVAVDERRRMARDMHDGLAQELAFIATHSQRLSHTGEDAATVQHLQAAAERALHDSRTTIAALISPDEAPLDRMIARTAESFRSRFGVTVNLDLEDGVIVDVERRNALLRILHEALINAIRHGRAQEILVRLAGGPKDLSLRISDDGSGFDVQAVVSEGKGLGLTSMRERAQLLGGSLSIASRPGSGTVVEVGLG